MHDDLLKTTFQRFDVDNSGYITLENLRCVLGESFNSTEVEKLIQEADSSKDGRISYEEFITFLKEGDGGDALDEVAGKIIDTEIAKPNHNNAVGSLGWIKDAACGLMARGGKSSTGQPSATTSQIQMASSMQVHGGSQTDMKGGDMKTSSDGKENSPGQGAKPNQKTNPESACCSIL